MLPLFYAGACVAPLRLALEIRIGRENMNLVEISVLFFTLVGVLVSVYWVFKSHENDKQSKEQALMDHLDWQIKRGRELDCTRLEQDTELKQLYYKPEPKKDDSCPYCGSYSLVDDKGHCLACGAPMERPKMKVEKTHVAPTRHVMSYTSSPYSYEPNFNVCSTAVDMSPIIFGEGYKSWSIINEYGYQKENIEND